MSSTTTGPPYSFGNRTQRANLPNTRPDRMFVLSNSVNIAQAYYDLSQQDKACSTTADCCTFQNQQLGTNSVRYFNPKCVEKKCQWNFTEYPRITGTQSTCSTYINNNDIIENYQTPSYNSENHLYMTSQFKS